MSIFERSLFTTTMSVKPSPSMSAVCSRLIPLSIGKISGPLNPNVVADLSCAGTATDQNTKDSAPNKRAPGNEENLSITAAKVPSAPPSRQLYSQVRPLHHDNTAFPISAPRGKLAANDWQMFWLQIALHRTLGRLPLRSVCRLRHSSPTPISLHASHRL